MSKITDPFAPRPFTGGSPLAGTERAFAPRINVQSVEEQSRAVGIPAGIDARRAAPTFERVPTPPPYESRTPVITNPNPAPKGGGSKS